MDLSKRQMLDVATKGATDSYAAIAVSGYNLMAVRTRPGGVSGDAKILCC